jgi:queuine tRNA-ribosyltransferase
MHNLRYYQRLMAGLRQAIASRTLESFAAEFYARRQCAAASQGRLATAGACPQ